MKILNQICLHLLHSSSFSFLSPNPSHHLLFPSLFPAGGGGGTRPWPGFLLLPTDPQNQHKVQKTSSLWFDFSPFCLRWTSRQSVFVFSSWARVGGGFERSGSRTGDLCSPTPFPERVPSSPYTSPTTWNSKQRLWTGGGDKSQPTGKIYSNLS